MAYPPETVIAEKYQALVSLGMANSRMKDFFDLWIIAQEFEFDGSVLSVAIHNTFSRRQTPLPDQIPIGLSSEFHEDNQKNNQWNAFLRRGKLTTDLISLSEVCNLLELFLAPPTQAVIRNQHFTAKWEPGGPWVSNLD